MAKHGTSPRVAKSRAYYEANAERIKARVSQYRATNAEKVKAGKKEYVARNRTQVAAKSRSYQVTMTDEQRLAKNARSRQHYLENVARIRERHSEYYKAKAAALAIRARERHQENPGVRREKLARRRATLKQATPLWLTKSQIREMHATYRSVREGEHVDHMVPLAGELVCGLHVPWNLAVIPAEINRRKQNKWPFDLALAA